MMKLNYKKTKNKECYKNVTKILKLNLRYLIMKRIFSLLKRAGKAYCKAYTEANTIKLGNGKVAYIGGTFGNMSIVYVS